MNPKCGSMPFLDVPSPGCRGTYRGDSVCRHLAHLGRSCGFVTTPCIEAERPRPDDRSGRSCWQRSMRTRWLVVLPVPVVLLCVTTHQQGAPGICQDLGRIPANEGRRASDKGWLGCHYVGQGRRGPLDTTPVDVRCVSSVQSTSPPRDRAVTCGWWRSHIGIGTGSRSTGEDLSAPPDQQSGPCRP